MFKKVLLPISALIALIAISILTTAQTATKPIARFTATTESQSVRIEVFAWSTEADRDEFAKAWTSPPKPAAVVEAEAPAGNRGGGGRGNRGGGRGNRGGGRGGGGDEAPPPAPVAPITPAASLGSSLNKAASVGMVIPSVMPIEWHGPTARNASSSPRTGVLARGIMPGKHRQDPPTSIIRFPLLSCV